ncbi:MAG: M48 family metalloprotease, partial [Thermoplasmata archaeon]|nr:M48 family metalloprotease [Thermoplasmata archaeon]
MASLGALKRSMALTLILIFGLLFVLLIVVSTLLQWYMGDIGFPFWIQIAFIVFITVFFVLIQWAISPGIIRWSSKLHYLKPGENPFLESTVKELCQKSGVPMPRLAVSRDRSPNAFVFGRSKSSATLAVHVGLLEQLNKNEIRGVLAHEVGHLKHNDMVVMTIVSVVPLLAFMLARSVLWSGGRNRGSGYLMIAAAVGFAVYVISQLMILKLSRQREFYADTFSAVSTGDPHSLSSALAKITYGLSLSKEKPGAARSFYIGDPVTARREVATIMRNRNKYDLDGDGVL